MKVFANKGTNGNYFTTSFYHKDKETGSEIKKNIYVGFQKEFEPQGTKDFDLIARDKEGNEYKVILDCWSRNGVSEPKFFFYKPKENGANLEDKVSEFVEENNITLDDISPDNLPFY